MTDLGPIPAPLRAPELKGRVALVTGGGRGIGRACALALAASGVRVMVNYRGNADAAARTVAEADALCAAAGVEGDRAAAMQADIGTAGGAESAVAATAERFGVISVLVNNAGITRDKLVLRMAAQDWDDVLATNLSGAFHTSKAAIKLMLRQRWGRIVNISSVAGVVGNAGQANYSAAKAGMIGLTRALAKEVGSRQITVNAVAPGFIRTEMTEAMPAAVLEGAPRAISLGRIGVPEEVSGVVLFLCSDAARYITGEVIRVDGGLAL